MFRGNFLVHQSVTIPAGGAIFQYNKIGFIPGSDLPKKSRQTQKCHAFGGPRFKSGENNLPVGWSDFLIFFDRTEDGTQRSGMILEV